MLRLVKAVCRGYQFPTHTPFPRLAFPLFSCPPAGCKHLIPLMTWTCGCLCTAVLFLGGFFRYFHTVRLLDGGGALPTPYLAATRTIPHAAAMPLPTPAIITNWVLLLCRCERAHTNCMPPCHYIPPAVGGRLRYTTHHRETCIPFPTFPTQLGGPNLGHTALGVGGGEPLRQASVVGQFFC